MSRHAPDPPTMRTCWGRLHRLPFCLIKRLVRVQGEAFSNAPQRWAGCCHSQESWLGRYTPIQAECSGALPVANNRWGHQCDMTRVRKKGQTRRKTWAFGCLLGSACTPATICYMIFNRGFCSRMLPAKGIRKRTRSSSRYVSWGACIERNLLTAMYNCTTTLS